MTSPSTSPYPHELADALDDVTERLQHALGVTIVRTTSVPDADIGWWESPTNTVVVRADATTEEQVWLLVHVWLYIVVGEDAVNAAPEPMLTLVPAQRS